MRAYNNNSCPLCREQILSNEELGIIHEEEQNIIPNYDINIITDNTDDNYTTINMNDQNVNVIPYENENIELNDNIINLDIDIINNISNEIINDIINLDNNMLENIFNNNNSPQDVIDITNMISNNNLNNITTHIINS